MTTWEEQKLFDVPATHRQRTLGRCKVVMRVEFEIEVDLDDLDKIEAAAKKSDPTLPAHWKTDPRLLKWAIGCMAWQDAEHGYPEIVDVMEVEHTGLPDGFATWDALAGEIRQPTWLPIEGAS